MCTSIDLFSRRSHFLPLFFWRLISNSRDVSTKRRSSTAIFSVDGGSEMAQHEMAENFKNNIGIENCSVSTLDENW